VAVELSVLVARGCAPILLSPKTLPVSANGVLQSSCCAIWQIVATHVLDLCYLEKSHKFVLLLLLFSQ